MELSGAVQSAKNTFVKLINLLLAVDFLLISCHSSLHSFGVERIPWKRQSSKSPKNWLVSLLSQDFTVTLAFLWNATCWIVKTVFSVVESVEIQVAFARIC
jgi:hypothetical protein